MPIRTKDRTGKLEDSWGQRQINQSLETAVSGSFWESNDESLQLEKNVTRRNKGQDTGKRNNLRS